MSTETSSPRKRRPSKRSSRGRRGRERGQTARKDAEAGPRRSCGRPDERPQRSETSRERGNSGSGARQMNEGLRTDGHPEAQTRRGWRSRHPGRTRRRQARTQHRSCGAATARSGQSRVELKGQEGTGCGERVTVSEHLSQGRWERDRGSTQHLRVWGEPLERTDASTAVDEGKAPKGVSAVGMAPRAGRESLRTPTKPATGSP